MAFGEDEIKTLVLKACDDNGTVKAEWDNLWAHSAFMTEADPSGELRYRKLVVEGLDLMLGYAAKMVSTSDGGGQSGQWSQYFDHLDTLRTNAVEAYKHVLQALSYSQGVTGVLRAVSLTPVLPGYIDPASPGYMGDPRYYRSWRTGGPLW